ncbi:5'/3'-nucleotidase SurE [Cytophagaceae bacterium ABcell3]|nr:5'/3'-nucleotidase SurE [Cytophagaceae bacterium ABcell3]
MRILISNDDGIYSPGILALAEVAKKFGEVRIVAPDVEQSSMSHAVTAYRPLTYKHTPIQGGFEAYRVNGTPADCVSLGISQWDNVDVVLSGINLGPNLGNSIWHSGTLAAAKQATLLGVRGIAFSVPVSKDEPEFDNVIPFVEQVLEELLKEKTPDLINVNLPENPRDIMYTRQSVRHYDGKVVEDRDPMGRQHFWFTVTPLEATEEGTDRWAVENNYVSITPLRIDLTDGRKLENMKKYHKIDVC